MMLRAAAPPRASFAPRLSSSSVTRAPALRAALPARRPALAPIRAAAAGGGASAIPEPAPPAKAGPLAGLKSLATPFTDPVANGRLVALCIAQMLCSVATLIHDT